MTVNNGELKRSDIVNLLRAKTNISDIKLPRGIEFSIQNGMLNMYINKPFKNMQSDDAAFEGWIMPLKVVLSDVIKSVELDYSSPSNSLDDRLGIPKGCHFNRFLYRINNFLRLFPEWFTVSERKKDEVSDFMGWMKQARCMLNQPLRERKSVFEKTNNQERNIESWFRFHGGRRPLCELWGLDYNKLFNQLPVGVFYREVAKDQAVFTRVGAAVDLGGVSKDGSTLHIIELKCGNNKGIGVISEILFYTSILYDTCIALDSYFSFGKYKKSHLTPEMEIIQDKRIRKLHSHVLAECYHPLFSNEATSLLQKGLLRLDIVFDRAKYDYKENKLPELYVQ